MLSWLCRLALHSRLKYLDVGPKIISFGRWNILFSFKSVLGFHSVPVLSMPPWFQSRVLSPPNENFLRGPCRPCALRFLYFRCSIAYTSGGGS
jgi:hypothetical protein